MFLTRLILDPSSREVRRDLSDCQGLHRRVMSGFPDGASEPNRGARAQHGVLHRLDAERDSLVLYVQSLTRPSWECLPRDYLLATSLDVDNPATRPLCEAYEGIRPGQVLAFRLRANPTRKIDTRSGPDGARRNGRRVELRDDGARIDWLRRKEADGGFRLMSTRVRTEVPDVRIGRERKVHGWRSASMGGQRRRVTLAPVLYEGLLSVIDADRFRAALRAGIGPAKAYGFGLMSIAPASE